MVAGLQHTRAQYVYGTTGLLHAPSADMQRDKTFLCGFSYLQVAATPKHWNYVRGEKRCVSKFGRSENI